MNETASKLPEYPVVMAMEGVGPSLGPQLMAEIGDVTRFTHKGAVTAFAGVDPGVNAFRRLFSEKRTCFQTRFTSVAENFVSRSWTVLIKTKPDDAVYLVYE